MADNVWMKVTKDKYELPVAVADTASELERMLGLSHKEVIRARYANKSGNCQYVKVDLSNYEDDEE